MGTKEYILSRGAHCLLIWYLIITVNFIIFRIMPGDPRMALLEPGMTVETRQAIADRFGLNKPLYEQYLLYIWNLFHGDFGESFKFFQDVSDIIISRRLSNTFILMGSSILIATILGVLMGVISSWKYGTRTDVSSLIFFLVTYSIPIFWLGLILLLAFGRYGFGVRDPWPIFVFVIGCAAFLLIGVVYAARRYLTSRSRGDVLLGIVCSFFFVLVVYSIKNPWRIPFGGTISSDKVHESWGTPWSPFAYAAYVALILIGIVYAARSYKTSRSRGVVLLVIVVSFAYIFERMLEKWVTPSLFIFTIVCMVLLLYGIIITARRYQISRSGEAALFGFVLVFFSILVLYSIIKAISWSYVTDYFIHMAAPLFALTISFVGQYYLVMRDSVLDIFTEDYMLAARAKGLSTRRILYRHAGRNAMLPMISLVAMSMPYLVGGAIMTETVFSYFGIGKLTIDALLGNDLPILQGIFVLYATMVVLSNFLADLLYAYLDPRVRYG